MHTGHSETVTVAVFVPPLKAEDAVKASAMPHGLIVSTDHAGNIIVYATKGAESVL